MSDPSSCYVNIIRYYADRDPMEVETALDINFLINNFGFPTFNIIEWINTSTMNNFRLYNIDSSKNLIWKTYNFS